MAQVFTALKLALPGVDVTYYGSEIGMENTHVRSVQARDTDDSGGQRNIGSRDFARSPMQWNDKDNAGSLDGRQNKGITKVIEAFAKQQNRLKFYRSGVQCRSNDIVCFIFGRFTDNND